MPGSRPALSVLLTAASGASQLHASDARLCPAPQNKMNHMETLTQKLSVETLLAWEK